MLKKIVLERFRGFKRLELDVPEVLVLMGPKSSGKTTVLHTEIWQRGKDRASFILGEIRKLLGADANTLTTSLSKVIERADVNLFPAGNPAVIPPEIAALLDWMTSNA
ncbi:MAG: hypothetical protein GX639_02165 [Fibrobacter sp.]|nr:hypothetical protein [Fibrobacter sp.]